MAAAEEWMFGVLRLFWYLLTVQPVCPVSGPSLDCSSVDRPVLRWQQAGSLYYAFVDEMVVDYTTAWCLCDKQPANVRLAVLSQETERIALDKFYTDHSYSSKIFWLGTYVAEDGTTFWNDGCKLTMAQIDHSTNGNNSDTSTDSSQHVSYDTLKTDAMAVVVTEATQVPTSRQVVVMTRNPGFNDVVYITINASSARHHPLCQAVSPPPTATFSPTVTWMYLGNSSQLFAISKTEASLLEARKACAALGADVTLASLDTGYYDVTEYLLQHRNTSEEFWVDATRPYENQSFVWWNGQPLDPAFWYPGEPSKELFCRIKYKALKAAFMLAAKYTSDHALHYICRTSGATDLTTDKEGPSSFLEQSFEPGCLDLSTAVPPWPPSTSSSSSSQMQSPTVSETPEPATSLLETVTAEAAAETETLFPNCFETDTAATTTQYLSGLNATEAKSIRPNISEGFTATDMELASQSISVRPTTTDAEAEAKFVSTGVNGTEVEEDLPHGMTSPTTIPAKKTTAVSPRTEPDVSPETDSFVNVTIVMSGLDSTVTPENESVSLPVDNITIDASLKTGTSVPPGTDASAPTEAFLPGSRTDVSKETETNVSPEAVTNVFPQNDSSETLTINTAVSQAQNTNMSLEKQTTVVYETDTTMLLRTDPAASTDAGTATSFLFHEANISGSPETQANKSKGSYLSTLPATHTDILPTAVTDAPVVTRTADSAAIQNKTHESTTFMTNTSTVSTEADRNSSTKFGNVTFPWTLSILFPNSTHGRTTSLNSQNNTTAPSSSQPLENVPFSARSTESPSTVLPPETATSSPPPTASQPTWGGLKQSQQTPEEELFSTVTTLPQLASVARTEKASVSTTSTVHGTTARNTSRILHNGKCRCVQEEEGTGSRQQRFWVVEADVAAARRELVVDARNMSAARRNKMSAYDNRVSAAATGLTVSLVFGALFAAIVVSDLPRLWNDFAGGQSRWRWASNYQKQF